MYVLFHFNFSRSSYYYKDISYIYLSLCLSVSVFSYPHLLRSMSYTQNIIHLLLLVLMIIVSKTNCSFRCLGIVYIFLGIGFSSDLYVCTNYSFLFVYSGIISFGDDSEFLFNLDFLSALFVYSCASDRVFILFVSLCFYFFILFSSSSILNSIFVCLCAIV